MVGEDPPEEALMDILPLAPPPVPDPVVLAPFAVRRFIVESMPPTVFRDPAVERFITE